MAIITEVKCGRCDRLYSAVRTRCPYCGAHRGAQNKHASDAERRRGVYIISLACLAVLVIAVIVLATNVAAEPDADPNATASIPPSIPGENDNVGLPGIEVSYEPLPPSPSPTPKIDVVESVQILYSGTIVSDFSESVGTKILLKLKITPEDTSLKPVWTSGDSEYFEVVPTDTTGTSATVHILKGGKSVTLTVTVGDVTATCIVRCKA
ncbi:MAG: hypothetical protein LBT36_06045 [Oscillospiraceae bacterium]|jgi:hypothetical protein|nr:hypothetical protein [Oscillospiraceae bacterium]